MCLLSLTTHYSCFSSIIEPRSSQISNQDDPINDALSPGGGKPYFSDTHFPVHAVLSRHFGTFLGNSSTTFMLVTIQKPAQFQQQVSDLPIFYDHFMVLKYVVAFRRRSNHYYTRAKPRISEAHVPYIIYRCSPSELCSVDTWSCQKEMNMKITTTVRHFVAARTTSYLFPLLCGYFHSYYPLTIDDTE